MSNTFFSEGRGKKGSLDRVVGKGQTNQTWVWPWFWSKVNFPNSEMLWFFLVLPIYNTINVEALKYISASGSIINLFWNSLRLKNTCSDSPGAINGKKWAWGDGFTKYWSPIGVNDPMEPSSTCMLAIQRLITKSIIMWHWRNHTRYRVLWPAWDLKIVTQIQRRSGGCQKVTKCWRL